MRNISKDKILSYLKRNKKLFKEKFGVIQIGIFGSFVRDEQKTGSDIDVVIEMERDKKNIHNFLNFKRFLENQLQAEIDLGLLNSLKPLIREKIENDIIYA